MSEIMREFGLEQREDAENSILLKLIKKGLSPEYIFSFRNTIGTNSQTDRFKQKYRLKQKVESYLN